jgi:hypothetical protein
LREMYATGMPSYKQLKTFNILAFGQNSSGNGGALWVTTRLKCYPIPN